MQYIILISSCLIASCLAQQGPEVETTYGRIRGAYDVTTDGSPYERYFGVEFGAAPVGELRFAKPIPPEPWQGVRDATNFGFRCSDGYYSFDSSEDCLNINIYVPGRNRTSDNLAVMVFLHGGSYYYGSGKEYPSEDIAVYGDVIVITTNYRLGALGFLSTEDEASWGNYGLWDVRLSLEWIQANIQLFGGDPSRVTVFGQSAGAALASHILLSPVTEGLVQRAICISGSSAGYYGAAVPGAVAVSSRILGTTFGCADVENSQALVDCLRQQDPDDINYWAWTAISTIKQHNPNFIPVVDNEFVPIHPYHAWNGSLPSGRDLMTGNAIHDGAGFILTKPNGELGPTDNIAETKERLDLGFRYATNQFPGSPEAKKAAIINQYPEFDADDVDTRTKGAVEVENDYWYDSGSFWEVHFHSQDPGSTYLYEYAYLNSFLSVLYEEEYDWVIADHSDELYSIFGEELWKDYREGTFGNFSAEDRRLSQEVMAYFTNFAKTGNPNDGLPVPVEWPEYTRESNEFLQFAAETQVLSEPPEKIQDYYFWMSEFIDVAIRVDAMEGNQPDDVPKLDAKGIEEAEKLADMSRMPQRLRRK